MVSHQCKYLVDAECQRQDEREAGLAARRGDAKADPQFAYRHLQKATRQGDVTVLVHLIRFADHTDRNVPGQSYFDALFNGGSESVNAVGSIKEWMF